MHNHKTEITQYSYDGNQVQTITQDGEGTDFYGRTGYALSDGTYTWNEAGLLNSDSSRGIVATTYNHQGLPKRQTISEYGSTSETSYTYSCDGQLLCVSSGLGRYYSGNRIFQGNKMLYSYFPGGYFDENGAAHYTHTDYQGSIIAVTDSTGKVVQQTDYYPYGEPFTEPSGQPMLFGGKERTSTPDYRFGPRNLMSAALLWDAPDMLAGQFRQFSPYTYCAGNPILYIDPSGKEIYISNNFSLIEVFIIMLNLQQLTNDKLNFTTLEDGTRKVEIKKFEDGEKVTGTRLIRDLNSNKHRVDIGNNGTNEWEAKPTGSDESHLYDGTGVNTFINYAFIDVELPTVTTKGMVMKSTSAAICFAHELIHTWHHVNGMRAEGEDYDLSGTYVPNEELETIGIKGNQSINENSIRREQGLEPRGSYNEPLPYYKYFYND